MRVSLQKNLLNWYKKNARDLPWRHTQDPYKIWVSEIMLQQTQVATVIPYYEKWLKRFPDLQSLAKTDANEVMKYWAGLGYYRRARMLHQAAQELAANGGKVPDSSEKLLRLPGIGRYTAGAIASIAFDESTPVLDGNVIRILTRIFGIKKDVTSPKTVNELWSLAASLIPTKLPGDFNQAMMELGATVCVPANPACLLCPVSNICQAYKTGRPENFPFKGRREKIEKLRTAALILRNTKNEVLIQKQPEHARWGGLWMFPFWQSKKEMLRQASLKEDQILHRLTVKHAFTRYQIQLEVYDTSLPFLSFLRERSDCKYQNRFARRLYASTARRGFKDKSPRACVQSSLDTAPFLHSHPKTGLGDVSSENRNGKFKSAKNQKHLDCLEGRKEGHFQWQWKMAFESSENCSIRRLSSNSSAPGRQSEMFNYRWVKLQALSKYPFPAPHQKIVKELLNNGK